MDLVLISLTLDLAVVMISLPFNEPGFFTN